MDFEIEADSRGRGVWINQRWTIKNKTRTVNVFIPLNTVPEFIDMVHLSAATARRKVGQNSPTI